MLDQFIDQYMNQVPSYDSEPNNMGQSPQLIAEWCTFLGLPFQWADAADWWGTENEDFLKHWQLVKRPDNNEELPVRGSIIVFSDHLPGSGGLGHLSLYIGVGEKPGEWIGFDSNWGGQSAHRQSHNWSYVMGWYTPKNRSVLESSIPTSIATPGPDGAYDAEALPMQVVTLKNDAALYNLANMSWDSFGQDGLGILPVGIEVSITGIARHRLGGSFLMPDLDKPEGFAVEDCTDYAANYVEMYEEDVSKLQGSPGEAVAMRAPLSAPDPTDIVAVKDPIPAYKSNTDALHGENSYADIFSGNYFVYKRLPNGTMNITKELGALGVWINPDDLKPKKPTDWRVLEEYPKPQWYKALEDTEIVDVEGWKRPMHIRQAQVIKIAGEFTDLNGVVYAAPDITYHGQQRQWYGVERQKLTLYQHEEVVRKPEPTVLRDRVKIDILSRLKQKF